MKTGQGPDGKLRCAWCLDWSPYVDYHDTEWGHPCTDDQKLFEKLCLEGFQSGLSWRTILGKRDNFRRAFANFDIEALARFTEKDVQRLLQDAGIVRHRKKIEATIGNAKRAKELIAREGSLAKYLWSYRPPGPRPAPREAIAQSPESKALSKDLKKRGWSFVGPTTAYAFMQSMGLVNDHAKDCAFRAIVQAKLDALII